MFSFLLFLCCFVSSLYNLLFKYKILFLDKERTDGNTTRGSLSISFINFLFTSLELLQFTCWTQAALTQTLLVLPFIQVTSWSNFPALDADVTVKDPFQPILFLSRNQIHHLPKNCLFHVHCEHEHHQQFKDLKPNLNTPLTSSGHLQ